MRDLGLEATLAEVRLEGDPQGPSLRQTLTAFYALKYSVLGQSVDERVDLAIERLGRAAQAALGER